MQAPLPCWQQQLKAFKRQSRAQQTLGKSPSETEAAFTASPGNSLGIPVRDPLTFPAPAIPRTHLLSRSNLTSCSSTHHPRARQCCRHFRMIKVTLQDVGGVGHPKATSGCGSRCHPSFCHPCSLAQLLKVKPSAPASREELLSPREEQRSLCKCHPGSSFRRIRELRRAAPLCCRRVAADVRHIGAPWHPQPRTKGSIPTSPLKRRENPRGQPGTRTPRYPVPPQGLGEQTGSSAPCPGMCFPSNDGRINGSAWLLNETSPISAFPPSLAVTAAPKVWKAQP